jgi:hypothetical protein
MKPNVGSLRQQCALKPAETQIELVAEDPALQAELRSLEIVEFYPDTTNAAGEWESTFKIKVRRRA